MDIRDVEALDNYLSRICNMDRYNEDLIKDAIFALEQGNEYRASRSLSTLASNLRNEGEDDAARAVERLI